MWGMGDLVFAIPSWHLRLGNVSSSLGPLCWGNGKSSWGGASLFARPFVLELVTHILTCLDITSLTAWMVYVMANIVSVDEFWTIPAVPSQNAGTECLEDAADEVPKPRLKLIWKLNDVECLSS